MNSLNFDNLDVKVCRACLVTGADVVFFKLGKLSRFFTDYLNFEVSADDRVWICWKCTHIITKTLYFGDTVCRANKILLNAVKTVKREFKVDVKTLNRHRKKLNFDKLSIHVIKSPINFKFLDDSKQDIEGTFFDDSFNLKLEHLDGNPLEDANNDFNGNPSNWIESEDGGDNFAPRDELVDGNILSGDDNIQLKKRSKVAEKITVINLTEEEALEEQKRLAEEAGYLNSLYKCTLCYKGLATLETYNTHMECHSESFGKLKCEICHKYYKTHKSFKLHATNHTKRYRCNACGQQGISREGLLRHYSMVHELTDSLPCSICDRVFRNLYVLQHHVRYTHKKKQRCECQHCGKFFANKCSLRQHCIRKHSDNLPEGNRRHVCEVCGHKFLDVTNMREHMAKHSSVRDFYCADCDASFKTRLALQTHFKSTLKHADPDKLILCQHCALKFADNRTLARHVRDNHCPTAFKCDRCPKQYCGRSQLRTHMRFAHEGQTLKRKYVCDACGRAFAYKSVMMDHMNTHTGSRPHKCKECPSDFGNAAALYRHNKLVHCRNKDSKNGTVVVQANSAIPFV